MFILNELVSLGEISAKLGVDMYVSVKRALEIFNTKKKKRNDICFMQSLLPINKYPIKALYTMVPEFITIRNNASDAPAANEISYTISNNNQVSYHVAVDDKESIQAIPCNRSVWHCGGWW